MGEQLWGKVPDDADGKEAENESAADLHSREVIGQNKPFPEGGTGKPRGNGCRKGNDNWI